MPLTCFNPLIIYKTSLYHLKSSSETYSKIISGCTIISKNDKYTLLSNLNRPNYTSKMNYNFRYIKSRAVAKVDSSTFATALHTFTYNLPCRIIDKTNIQIHVTVNSVNFTLSTVLPHGIHIRIVRNIILLCQPDIIIFKSMKFNPF